MVSRGVSSGAVLAAMLLATVGCGANKLPSAADQGSAVPSAPASASGTSAPAVGAATAPAPGTVLQHLSGRGRANVVTNGAGFTFIDSYRSGSAGDGPDQSVITAYDAAGTQLARISGGPFTGECGVADVVVGGRRTLLTELVVNQPARGIDPALFAVDMDAWDAVTGTRLWHEELIPAQKSSIGCSASDGELEGFAATHDGKWGLYTTTSFANVEVHEVIDLVTGRSHSVPRATGVVGNYLVHSEPAAENTDFFDPADGKMLTTAANHGFGNTESPVVSSRFGPGYTGLTADGGKVVSLDTSDDAVVVAALPGLRKLWSVPAPDDSYRIVGDQGGSVLVDHFEGQRGERVMIAYADDTGKERWRSPGGEVCGSTSSQLLLAVNRQLATLDLATGKQLAYRDAQNNGSGCPAMLPGGISAGGGWGELDVTQELRP
jgi:hypothetical protein